MKKSQLRELVREILSEEQYDLNEIRPNSTHRSNYARQDYEDRKKKALQAVDFPSDKITDFSKGNEYIKKVFTVQGMRDLVLKSNTFEEFETAIKKKTDKVSNSVLRKIYNLIKD